MTTTTIRKLVVTSLVTGIVQADGLLESLPLPLWVIQFVRAGIELAFIGSASALVYEVGSYGWKLAVKPREKSTPSAGPETVVEETQRGWMTAAKALGARIVALEARLTELDGTAKTTADAPQPTLASDSAPSIPSQAPEPATAKAKGQQVQQGKTPVTDVLVEALN